MLHICAKLKWKAAFSTSESADSVMFEELRQVFFPSSTEKEFSAKTMKFEWTVTEDADVFFFFFRCQKHRGQIPPTRFTGCDRTLRMPRNFLANVISPAENMPRGMEL